MIKPLADLFDAGWRAAAYCLHPRMILLSLAPWLLIGGAAFGLSWFFWTDATSAVRDALASWELMAAVFKWLESVGLGGVKSMVGPLVVVFLAIPLVVVVSLLAVAWLATPSAVKLVAQRRFALLELRRGGTVWGSIFLGLTTAFLALVVLVATLPLWLVPPLALLLPPLIWGWLTYRVMSYDVLADHASRDERRELMRRHRFPLMVMGVLTGYVGMAPSLLWALGASSVVFAPLLMPVAVWVYTLVFLFSALWFSHYALAALAALRREQAEPQAAPMPPAPQTLPPEPLLGVTPPQPPAV